MGVLLIFLAPQDRHRHPTVIRSTTSVDEADAMAPFVEVSSMASDIASKEEPCLSANRVKCRLEQMGGDDSEDEDVHAFNSRGLPNPRGYKAPTFATVPSTEKTTQMRPSIEGGIALSRKDSMEHVRQNEESGSEESSSCGSEPEEEDQMASSAKNDTSIELAMMPSLAVSTDDDNSITESEAIANRLRHDSVEDVHDVREDESSVGMHHSSEEQDDQPAQAVKQQTSPPVPVSSSLSDSSKDELTLSAMSRAATPSPSVQSDSFKPCLKTKLRSASKKRVSFDSVSVYYHSVGLGDSPSVSKGPPLALTWQRIHHQVYAHVDHYEDDRPDFKGKKKMRLKASRREKILYRAGVSEGEIKFCVDNIEKLKNEHERDMSTVDEDLHSIHQSYKNSPVPAGGVCCSSSTAVGTKEWLWLDWVCR